jgi:hypothetical protein
MTLDDYLKIGQLVFLVTGGFGILLIGLKIWWSDL